MVRHTTRRYLLRCIRPAQALKLVCRASALADSETSQARPSNASPILPLTGVCWREQPELAAGSQSACAPRIPNRSGPAKTRLSRQNKESWPGSARYEGGFAARSPSAPHETSWIISSKARPFSGLGGSGRLPRAARRVALFDPAGRFGELFRDFAQKLRRALFRFRRDVFLHESP